jgi:hypothetical protein
MFELILTAAVAAVIYLIEPVSYEFFGSSVETLSWSMIISFGLALVMSTQES